MTGIVILATQLGVALGSFVGMSKLMNWYHKGGEKNGNNTPKVRQPNN